MPLPLPPVSLSAILSLYTYNFHFLQGQLYLAVYEILYMYVFVSLW